MRSCTFSLKWSCFSSHRTNPTQWSSLWAGTRSLKELHHAAASQSKANRNLTNCLRIMLNMTAIVHIKSTNKEMQTFKDINNEYKVPVNGRWNAVVSRHSSYSSAAWNWTCSSLKEPPKLEICFGKPASPHYSVHKSSIFFNLCSFLSVTSIRSLRLRRDL